MQSIIRRKQKIIKIKREPNNDQLSLQTQVFGGEFFCFPVQIYHAIFDGFVNVRFCGGAFDSIVVRFLICCGRITKQKKKTKKKHI